MAAFLSSCECGADIGNSDHKFCTSCGLELLPNEQTIVTFYFSRGFEYKSIIHMLSKRHGIKMSERTLKNRLKEFGLRRKLALYDEAEVRRQIEQEMEGPGCMAGYRSMWHTLSMKGIRVPRRVVEEIMRELDPEGCETRRRKRLRRRKYRAPGPNYCWHVDGYDKLKPYGFPIHGCIDGWSRKIMWLRLVRSNNLPETAASHFVDCVDDYGGCPVKLRTDCGTENVIMAAMQCEFRQDVGAHIYGSSPANQRIEGWWSFYRRNRSTWWINYFKDMIENEKFNPGNELEKECIWFSFSGIIQKDLDFVKEHWNTHRIRDSRHDTVPGRPDELFCLPEDHGGVDGLILPISAAQIDHFRENFLQVEEETNVYQEYFNYVLSNSDLQEPRDWKEAENLYLALLSVARG